MEWIIEVGKVVLGGVLALIGGYVATSYKERVDRRLSLSQREKERNLRDADTLRQIIASIVGAKATARAAREADSQKRSKNGEVAKRAAHTYGLRAEEFRQLANTALVEAEKYGYLPESVPVPDRLLSTYVDYLIYGKLSATLEWDSYGYDPVSDASGHTEALLSDLRALMFYAESEAQRALSKGKKAVEPNLPYILSLAPYFNGIPVDPRKLNTDDLESMMMEAQSRAERIAERVRNREKAAAERAALTQPPEQQPVEHVPAK